jgi:hypothetical protein
VHPQIHLIDETWIDAPVGDVCAVVADRTMWQLWWPTLHLTVTRDRGVKGLQWAARSPELVGTVEIWLEPVRAGVVLHHFLRLDPADGRPLSRRAAVRLTRGFAWHAKRVFWKLKDDCEGSTPGRAAPAR